MYCFGQEDTKNLQMFFNRIDDPANEAPSGIASDAFHFQ